MATYPVVHKETGEQKEVVMSVHDWVSWTESNPDWMRDYSESKPGWNEVLANAQKTGKNCQKLTLD